jgi:hypothetical protein
MIMNRRILTMFASVVASLVVAPSVLAFECTNVSKGDAAAGAQVLFGPSGDIVWVTEGIARRLDQGLIDPATGDGFHGLVAFDLDGDGAADASTYIGVGPDGEIPLEAQFEGPACRGITNLGIYFEQCVGS